MTPEEKKKALAIQQIEQVVSYIDGLKTTERYRDLWFSCTCAMVSTLPTSSN